MPYAGLEAYQLSVMGTDGVPRIHVYIYIPFPDHSSANRTLTVAAVYEYLESRLCGLAQEQKEGPGMHKPHR